MMIDYPLMIKTILDRSNNLFAEKNLFAFCGARLSLYYCNFYKRLYRLANILEKMGINMATKSQHLPGSTIFDKYCFYIAPTADELDNTLMVETIHLSVGY